MTDGPTCREVELKLEIAEGDLAAFRAHPLLQNLSKPQRLISDYWDTPDLALHEAGLSLRIRARNGKRIQTLKTASSGAGLFMRGEWESPVAANAIDLEALEDTPLADLWRGAVQPHELQPLFRVQVERATRQLSQGATKVEVTLDQGQVIADGRRASLTEIELELQQGSPADLFALADTLFQVGPVRLSARSKSGVGYDLLRGASVSHEAEPSALDPNLRTADGMQAIARACLGHFLRNEHRVRDAGAPEAVHQARVALRRLRAALTLFKPLLGDPQTEALKERLKRLAASLGVVRDLDVLIARLAELALAPEARPDALLADLQSRRADALRSAVAALESAEARRVAFDTAAWIEAGDWLTATGKRAVRERPLIDFARHALHRRSRKLCRQLARLEELEVEARHRVRIRAKILRYAGEFFLPLATGKAGKRRAREFIGALKPVQEALGDYNDAANAARLLALARGEAGYAAGMAAERMARDAKGALKRARKAGRAFAETPPFLD